MNFFDHADIYCRGKSEEGISRPSGRKIPGLRDRIISSPSAASALAATQCRIRPTASISATSTSCARLKAAAPLKTDYLDVLLLHRPDPLVEPEEVARAFDELHQAGKVRWFGVSNHTAAQLELLRAHLRQPIVANQVALNIMHTHMLDEGVIFNQNNPNADPQRRHNRILPPAQHHPAVLGLDGLGAALRSRAGKSPLRPSARHPPWLLKWQRKRASAREAIVIGLDPAPSRPHPGGGRHHPAGAHRGCAQADEISLTREEWYRLYIAGRGEALP
jgi:predicted oxidoreductase